jgi:uncharacterized membrane protein
MSERGTRISLWLALVVALPVPIWLLGPGSVPVGHLFELGSAAVALGVVESFRGVVGLTALVFLGQAIVYATLLWLVATRLARARGLFRGVLLALVVLGLVVACFTPIYHSAYNARAAQVTLIEVYQ